MLKTRDRSQQGKHRHKGVEAFLSCHLHRGGRLHRPPPPPGQVVRGINNCVSSHNDFPTQTSFCSSSQLKLRTLMDCFFPRLFFWIPQKVLRGILSPSGPMIATLYLISSIRWFPWRPLGDGRTYFGKSLPPARKAVFLHAFIGIKCWSVTSRGAEFPNLQFVFWA